MGLMERIKPNRRALCGCTLRALFNMISLPERTRKVLLHSFILYALTFLVVLPILCHDRTFTVYFKLRRRNVRDIMAELTEKRDAAARDALAYLRAFNSSPATDAPGIKPLNTVGRDNIPDIAIGIITVKRDTSKSQYKSFHPKYVLEVTARLMQVLERTDSSLRAHFTLFICNAQSDPSANEEAVLLSKYVRTIYKENPEREKPWTADRHEQEKNDYGFCLREMSKFKADYTLILQDDALVHWDFIEVLLHVLGTKIERRYQRGQLVNVDTSNLAYVKLYFPEKWQGFAWEFRQAAELVAFGVAVGVILASVYGNIINRSINGAASWIFVSFITVLYSVLVALAIDRQNLMFLRYLSPELYYVRSAPECCIPAVLYNQRHIHDIVRYLESPDLKCAVDFPLDVAIALFVEKLGLESLIVEPNMVDHIGIFSTLHRGLKDPSSFFIV